MHARNMLRVGAALLAGAFGAFVIWFGGYDDSPSVQLLGIVLIVSGVVVVARGKK